jgi:hypothetical protein
MHDRRGADHQAYLWQYGKPGGETVFDFCLGRGREGPQKFLGEWEGILPSAITVKPAMRDHFKTGHMSRTQDLHLF